MGHHGCAVRNAGYTWIVVLRLVLKLGARYDSVIGGAFCLGRLARLGTISYGIWLMHPTILWLTPIEPFAATRGNACGSCDGLSSRASNLCWLGESELQRGHAISPRRLDSRIRYLPGVHAFLRRLKVETGTSGVWSGDRMMEGYASP